MRAAGLALLALALGQAHAGLLDPLVHLAPSPSNVRVAPVRAASSGAPPAKQVSGGLYGKSAPPSFPFASSKVRGVSLGGWLLLEPFITPSLFDATGSDAVVDERTFGQFYGAKAAAAKLDSHWKTFITQDDFKQIAAAGLNTVRVPIGYWAITSNDTAPFPTGQWPRLKAAVHWAKNANLTVIVDLHGAKRSQNGFDNSGERTDTPGWYTASNVNNALQAMQIIATEFRKAEYKQTVSAIELVNEPQPKSSADWNVLYDYLSRAYAIVHAPGRKYAVTFHNAFRSLSYWSKFMPKSSAFKDVILTAHPYLLFDRGAVSLSDERKIEVICDMKSDLVASRKNYITHVAEWSPALSDCTRYLNGRGRGSRYDGTFDDQPAVGSCKGLTGDASKFSAAYKQRLGRYWNAQTRTYSNSDGWIAWTWKTEKGQAEEWSYQMGLRYGWIPKDASSYLYSDPC